MSKTNAYRERRLQKLATAIGLGIKPKQIEQIFFVKQYNKQTVVVNVTIYPEHCWHDWVIVKSVGGLITNVVHKSKDGVVTEGRHS